MQRSNISISGNGQIGSMLALASNRGLQVRPACRHWHRVLLTVAIVAAATVISTKNVTAAVVYRETFGNNQTSSNLPLSSLNWNGAQSGTGSVWVTPDNYNSSYFLGKPNSLDNINAGSPSLSLTKGFAYSAASNSLGKSGLLWTTEYTVSRTGNEVTYLSAYMGNASASATQQFAIQIGSNWYVSDTAYNSPAVSGVDGAFLSNAVQHTLTFSTDGSDWRSFAFNPGNTSINPTLAIGATLGSPLPTGDITGFGIYWTNPAGTGSSSVRFDTFQIESEPIPAPEPSSIVLLGLGALGLVRQSRRRRNAKA